MSRPSDRKTQILAVASEMFAARGYSGTGVDEIGAAVGVTGPALYRHFPNKQAMLDEICVAGLQVLLDDTERILDERLPPSETLERLVRMRVEFAYGPHRHSFAISHLGDSKLSSKADRKVAAMEDLYRAEWMRVLTEVRPKATTVELHVAWFAAHMLIGYAEGSGEIRDEVEQKRHLERMALAVLLA